MLDYYIHQIGDINNPETYNRLKSILDTKFIHSRKKLKEVGIIHNYENKSYKLNIPPEKEHMYYMDDIHYDRVSLSDPNNRFIKHAIKRKDHNSFTCFDYNYIAFAISKDIKIVSSEETHSLALGEIQVQDSIGEEFNKGIILPFEVDDLNNENILKIIDMISVLCDKSGIPLDIYNYKGELLKKKSNKKIK